uniref:Uncharacterized protein n=1 Tax=Terrapene triunguis TaxID=2587831 RepID=A0A674HYW6_9SAUR
MASAPESIQSNLRKDKISMRNKGALGTARGPPRPLAPRDTFLPEVSSSSQQTAGLPSIQESPAALLAGFPAEQLAAWHTCIVKLKG